MFEFYYNHRIKKYPNGVEYVTTFNKTVFNPLHHKKDVDYSERDNSRLPFGPDIETRLDNLKRSREAVFDIALLNNFEWFVTLTFDDNIIDAKNEIEVNRVVKNFFRNMVLRHDLKYLCVPELHKSGRVHLHCLMSGELSLVDSCTDLIPQRKKPVEREKSFRICPDIMQHRQVFNLSNWKYGFSTAVRFKECDDGLNGTMAIAKYITKYMTKDLCKILKHYYYAGGHLIRDVETEYKNVIFEDMDGIPVEIIGTELQVKYCVRGVF